MPKINIETIYKNLFILFVILAVTVFFTLWNDHKSPPSSAPSNTAQAEKSLKKIPDFTFQDIKGKTHNIRDYKGRIVILNFWASWCAPCVKEFPLLTKIAEDFKDEVTFIALSSDISKDTVHRFLKKHKIKHKGNVIIAHDETLTITQDLFHTVRLPETLIINQNQHITAKLVGANWTYEDMEKILESQRP